MIRYRVLRLPVAHLRRITAELSRDLLRYEKPASETFDAQVTPRI
jgi:hypothetical protein